MNSKYYIPDISEVFVGFEYEEYNEYRDEWCKRILTKEDLEYLGSFMYGFLESFESNNIRVKYLDKSDIEELGFTAGKSNGMRNWYYTDETSKYFGERLPANSSYSFWEIKLIHDPKYNWLKIEAKTSDGEWYTFFEGIIRNVNELKKLLKQLGIE